MALAPLSTRDSFVLAKINDADCDPAAAVETDASLPRDPHLVDSAVYEDVVQRERSIVHTVQAVDTPADPLGGQEQTRPDTVQALQACVARLDALIAEHPCYASARNNRIQILRRLYGDTMLLLDAPDSPASLLGSVHVPRSARRRAAATALDDADRCVALLTPAAPAAPAMSPQAARTLSMVHTQRAALYLAASKQLPHHCLDIDPSRPEASWSRLALQEAASRDFAQGARYGNHIAKALAVAVNPTAKLCGQIVRDALHDEYGPSYAAFLGPQPAPSS